jgi:hypothetical protein
MGLVEDGYLSFGLHHGDSEKIKMPDEMGFCLHHSGDRRR